MRVAFATWLTLYQFCYWGMCVSDPSNGSPQWGEIAVAAGVLATGMLAVGYGLLALWRWALPEKP